MVHCGRKLCYEVTTASRLAIVTTEDQKFFYRGGFVPLGELHPGDSVGVHKCTPVVGRKRLPSRKEVFVKWHPQAVLKVVGDSYFYFRLSIARAVVEAAMNKVKLEEYIHFLNQGASVCAKNGIVQYLPADQHIHHLDGNIWNNDISNLAILTAQEHGRTHMADKDRKKNLSFVPTEDKIVSIRLVGRRDTYDLKMRSPSNNFVANGFIVHNSGKSTLAMSILRNTQRQLGTSILIDTENSFNRTWAKQIGVNMGDLVIAQPDHIEAVIEYINHILTVIGGLKEDSPLLICWDSLAATPTSRELDSEISEHGAMAETARLMSRATKQLGGKLPKHRASLLIVNQIREKVGVMYGDKTTTPGGKALKFHASVRLKIERIKTIKSGNNASGIQCRVTVVKSKVCQPFRTAEFPIMFSTGLDNKRSLIDFGVCHNLLEVKRKSGTVLFKGKEINVEKDAKFLQLVSEALDASTVIPDAIEEDSLGKELLE